MRLFIIVHVVILNLYAVIQLAVLKLEDVRGMSERAMTTEEKEEHQRVCRMAGWSGDDDIHDVVTTPVVTFDPRLALGEGRRTLSWIWYTMSEQDLQGNSKELQASEYWLSACCSKLIRDTGLRVEWAETHARANRWREELMLLDEEMRQSLDFCWRRAQWWKSRMHGRTEVSVHVAEGVSAYALKQSEAEEQRAMRWAIQWSAIRGRAQSILKSQASDNDDNDWWPELVVDIPDE